MFEGLDENELTNRFVGLCKKVQQASSDGSLSSLFEEGIKAWASRGSDMKIIKRRSAENYRSILQMLFKVPEVASHFTRKEVEKKIQDTIDAVIEEHSTIEEGSEIEVEKMLKYFQSEISNIGKWQFVLPLVQLEVESLPLDVGKVRLSKFTQTKYEEWVDKERKILESNPYHSSKEVEGILKRNKNYVYSLLMENELFDEPVCAEIEVKNRYERAHETAVNETKKALQAIKLFWTPHHDNIKAYFGLMGEVGLRNAQGRRSAHLGRTKDKIRHRPTSSGSVAPFELDDDLLEEMNQWGFQELCDILGKESPNKLERRIMAAIYWFGEAVDSGFPDVDAEKAKHYDYELVEGLENFALAERFLKFIIALETLLIRGHETKRENLAKRVAFLMGKGYESRKSIYDRIGSFYKIRNNIVHEGLVTSVEEFKGEEVGIQTITDRLMRDTQSTILILIQDRKKLGIDEEGIQRWSQKETLG